MGSRILMAVLTNVPFGSRRAMVALSICAALSACAPGDSRVPWDTSQMAREIARDLRQFERFEAEFRQVEVLGWRTVESQQRRPAPLDPIRRRDYHALVWVRAESAAGAAVWVLVEAAQGEDDPWRRVIINRELPRELRAPLTHPRPGEDPDGTWHGFARYPTPPTSADVCDFARGAFLKPFQPPDSHVVVGELRRKTWWRVTGAEPVCGMNEW